MSTESLDVANQSVERRKDADDQPKSSKFWIGEVKAALKRDKPWLQRADKVLLRYRDDRDMDNRANSQRRANILWSNTETLKSTLFQGLGAPDVRRRFPKKNNSEADKAARQAALVLERGLSYCIDAYDAESQIEAAVEDYLLPGRGTAWLVYDAEFAEIGDVDETEDTGEGDEGVYDKEANLAGGPMGMAEEITSQTVRLEHVYFKDFLTSAGRKWSDVWWVARGHDYSRDELVRYFPKHGSKVPLDVTIQGFESSAKGKNSKDEEDTFKRGRVWEIWDKSKKERIYVAEGYPWILKRDADPYRLKDFYPTVEPLYGVKTTSSLTPIPEYTLYQDQAEELDIITTRLTRLIDALRRRGVYDGSAEGPDNQLSQMANAGDNEFVAYRNFAVLVEKGGLKNVFQTEDLQPIIAVVDKLQQHRITLVQTIYEITGISDIIRGASDPSETATAQKIKGQFGSLRLQKRQKRIQIFIRDMFRLKAEIMAEHFTREQLQEMTAIDMPLRAEQEQAKQQLIAMQMQEQLAKAMQAQQGPRPPGAPPPAPGAQGQPPAPQAPPAPMPAGPPPPPPDPKLKERLLSLVKAVSWEDISAILRSDQRRGYRVDIETDSLTQVNDEAEKKQRIEFMAVMQKFAETVVPGIMEFPAMAPFAKELATFALGAFKVGRTLEEVVDDTFTQLEQMAAQAMANGPKKDPEERKIELEAQAKQLEFQFRAKEAEQDRQIKTREMEHTAALEERKLQHSIQLETMKAQQEAQIKEREMQQELHFKSREMEQTLQMRQQEMHQQAQLKQQEFGIQQEQHQNQMGMEREKMGFEREKHAAGIHMEGAKAGMEQDKHAQELQFQRDKHNHELITTPVTDEAGQATNSLGAMMSAMNQAFAQQSQMLAQVLQQITEHNAQSMKMAGAARRLVRDPQTGEKRVEVVMQ